MVSSTARTRGQPLGQLATARIVDVHRRVTGALGDEQRGLGLEVGILVEVEVQVVPAEVGERRDREDEASTRPKARAYKDTSIKRGLGARWCRWREQALQLDDPPGW